MLSDADRAAIEAAETKAMARIKEVYGLNAAGIAAYNGDRARWENGPDPCKQPIHRMIGKPGLLVDSFSFTSHGRVASAVRTFDPLDIVLSLKAVPGQVYAVYTYLTFWSDDGHRVMRMESPIDRFTGEERLRNVLAHSDRLPLGAGTYRVSISIYDEAEKTAREKTDANRYDWLHRAFVFEVEDIHPDTQAQTYITDAKWTLGL